jgi:hypothetical protein
MNYYLIPEDEMKNVYIEESFLELYNKSASIDEIVKFEETLRKINIIEQHVVNEEIVDMNVNYYILKYKTKFPSVNIEFESKTVEQVKEILTELETLEP